MPMKARTLLICGVVFGALGLAVQLGLAQSETSEVWRDPSPHQAKLVTIDENIQLEVLDWGGSGRVIVLLAGGGNTVHVFDEFAPKLTSKYRVYGITRRGYGNSNAPESGYDADRLGDDILKVLDSLKLDRPVLVGHSLAGEELSSIGSRFPKRVSGLVYFDPGPSAYYDPAAGNVAIDLREFKKTLEHYEHPNGYKDSKAAIDQLLGDAIPRLQRSLRWIQENFEGAPEPPPPGPAPKPADLASFSVYQSWTE
jgi:pimeloyl-ACP methyl ester carboxylesterase